MDWIINLLLLLISLSVLFVVLAVVTVAAEKFIYKRSKENPRYLSMDYKEMARRRRQ